MILAILIYLSSIPWVFCICPSGFSSGSNGFCYIGYNDQNTWFQAEATCAQNIDGGHLASVENVFTNAVIGSLFAAQLNYSDIWLGGTTDYLGGNWSWSDSTAFSYTNFEPGRQNNSIGLCLVQRYNDLRWYPIECIQSRKFICEYPEVQKTSSPEFLSTTKTQSTPQISVPKKTSLSTLLPPPNCPNNTWLYYNETNKCYFFDMPTKKLNWHKSLAACNSLYHNATLVSIHSKNENLKLVDLAKSFSNESSLEIWIGLRQVTEFDVYAWIDGTPYNFTNISPGDGDPAPCVHLDPNYYDQDTKGYGSWFSNSCGDVAKAYICELEFV